MAETEPPEGWGYPDYDKETGAKDDSYTDNEWRDELLLDDGVDRWLEDEMDWDSESEQ